MLVNIILCSIAFKVLSIYYSMMQIIDIIIIYHNVPRCNIHLKYDHKGKITRNQKSLNQYKPFVYLLDAHYRVLIFQNFTSNC